MKSREFEDSRDHEAKYEEDDLLNQSVKKLKRKMCGRVEAANLNSKGEPHSHTFRANS